MYSVYTIKHKRQHTDIDKLGGIFCDCNNLRIASSDLKARTWTVGQQWRKLGDTSYADVLDSRSFQKKTFMHWKSDGTKPAILPSIPKASYAN